MQRIGVLVLTLVVNFLPHSAAAQRAPSNDPRLFGVWYQDTGGHYISFDAPGTLLFGMYDNLGNTYVQESGYKYRFTNSTQFVWEGMFNQEAEFEVIQLTDTDLVLRVPNGTELRYLKSMVLLDERVPPPPRVSPSVPLLDMETILTGFWEREEVGGWLSVLRFEVRETINGLTRIGVPCDELGGGQWFFQVAARDELVLVEPDGTRRLASLEILNGNTVRLDLGFDAEEFTRSTQARFYQAFVRFQNAPRDRPNGCY